jgi:hypothetical protein
MAPIRASPLVVRRSIAAIVIRTVVERVERRAPLLHPPIVITPIVMTPIVVPQRRRSSVRPALLLVSLVEATIVRPATCLQRVLRPAVIKRPALEARRAFVPLALSRRAATPTAAHLPDLVIGRSGSCLADPRRPRGNQM